ncbi:MAG: hypothetical protein AAFV74_19935 [Pseudomonadota bacterium]
MSRLSGRIKRIENLEAKNVRPDIIRTTFYENRQGEVDQAHVRRCFHPEQTFSLYREEGETEAGFLEKLEEVKAERLAPLSASKSKGNRE